MEIMEDGRKETEWSQNASSEVFWDFLFAFLCLETQNTREGDRADWKDLEFIMK